MVGANRTDMTRAYLIGVMLWPDDPERRREMMKTATVLHLRATLGTVPAAADAVADQVNLMTLALDALPLRIIHEKIGSRYFRGFLAGEFVGAAVVSDAGGLPVKLEHFKAAMTAEKHRKIHKGANISYSTLVNTILPRFRPVAHLWAFYVKGGTYVYGSYPDIDEMFQQQAVGLDHKRRTAILQKMQQLAYERSIYAPIWLLGFLNGVGPRVTESGFGLLPGYAYTAPYENITIKGD